MKMNKVALILDEAPLLRLQLSQLLDACGYRVECYGSRGVEPEQLAGAGVIFIELIQSSGNGFQTLRHYAARTDAPLILLTGTGRHSDLQWALQAGAATTLRRPLDLPRLRAALAQAGLEPREAPA